MAFLRRIFLGCSAAFATEVAGAAQDVPTVAGYEKKTGGRIGAMGTAKAGNDLFHHRAPEASQLTRICLHRIERLRLAAWAFFLGRRNSGLLNPTQMRRSLWEVADRVGFGAAREAGEQVRRTCKSEERPERQRRAGNPTTQCRRRNWRTGWDSNPRYACTYAAFRVRCLQPLDHLSAGGDMGTGPGWQDLSEFFPTSLLTCRSLF